MTPFRIRLSAIAILAAVLATTGGPLLALAIHPVCAAKHHDCGQTATISCCCGDAAAARDEGTPAQARVEVQGDLAATPALPHVAPLAPAPQPLSLVRTSPPRLCLLDLPTLFATFLI